MCQRHCGSHPQPVDRADGADDYQALIWIESVGHAAGLLLGFGDEVEVISPEALRKELALRAARVAAQYGAIATRER